MAVLEISPHKAPFQNINSESESILRIHLASHKVYNLRIRIRIHLHFFQGIKKESEIQNWIRIRIHYYFFRSIKQRIRNPNPFSGIHFSFFQDIKSRIRIRAIFVLGLNFEFNFMCGWQLLSMPKTVHVFGPVILGLWGTIWGGNASCEGFSEASPRRCVFVQHTARPNHHQPPLLACSGFGFTQNLFCFWKRNSSRMVWRFSKNYPALGEGPFWNPKQVMFSSSVLNTEGNDLF